MKVTLVGSSVMPSVGLQFASTYLIDDLIAIDAGTLGLIGSLSRQQAIQHVFLTHPHIDHIATLPLFLENVYVPGPAAPTLYSSKSTRDALAEHVFNERLWPDLFRLSEQESPFFRYQLLESGSGVEIGSLRITALELDHVVPCFAYVVEDSQGAVGFVSDTGPTRAIWEFLHRVPRLKAIFLEAAFPNELAWLATKAGHLTPHLFAHEYQKLQRKVPVYAVHIKPVHQAQVRRQLASLAIPELAIGEPDRNYHF
jgi:ribonuclease BN (tRNA processing enzyme)